MPSDLDTDWMDKCMSVCNREHGCDGHVEIGCSISMTIPEALLFMSKMLEKIHDLCLANQ